MYSVSFAITLRFGVNHVNRTDRPTTSLRPFVCTDSLPGMLVMASMPQLGIANAAGVVFGVEATDDGNASADEDVVTALENANANRVCPCYSVDSFFVRVQTQTCRTSRTVT